MERGILMTFKRSKTKFKQSKSKPKPIVELLSTGVDLLDLAIGGGFGRGTIVNIIGDNSSGKTLLVCETIAKARSQYKDTIWFFDNAEAGFSFDTMAMYGYQMLPENETYRSETVEDFIDNVMTQIDQAKKEKKRLIYVLDSLDALTSDAELGRAKERQKAKEAGKEYQIGTYNLEKQRLMNEFFRLNTSEIENTGTILIIISQTREKIGAVFGQKWRVSCEGALKFYAKQRILLKEIGKIKQVLNGKEHKIGVMIRANTIKNKIAPPFKECDFEILFDYGVDNISSNLDFLFDLKTSTGQLKKRIEIEWEDTIFKKRSEIIDKIESDNEEKLLLDKVTEKFKQIENNLAPKRKRKYENSID